MKRMNRGIALGLVVCAGLWASGCQSYQARRPVVTTDPPLAQSDGAVDEPAPRAVAFSDRHPLLYKPREYWETSGNNTIVKAAAATFVGVPAGILGEMRQIIVGAPPQPRY
jgi:hypothetical protein